MGRFECKDKDKGKLHVTRWVLYGSLIAISLWFLGVYGSPWLSTLDWKSVDMEKAGALGDSVAIINTLFSAIALVGVIGSIMLQSRELAEAKKDMDEQKKKIDTQNEALIRLQFENTFFNMLHLQQEITNCLNCTDPNSSDKLIQGRDVFHYFYNIRPYPNSQKGCEYLGLRRYLAHDGYDVYAKVSDIQIFDHYFRHMYRIVRYVHDSPLVKTPKDKYGYVCILRAMLSPFELLMLFYNGLCHPDFKKLIEEYALFNNLRSDELADKSRDLPLYRSTAYEYKYCALFFT